TAQRPVRRREPRRQLRSLPRDALRVAHRLRARRCRRTCRRPAPPAAPDRSAQVGSELVGQLLAGRRRGPLDRRTRHRACAAAPDLGRRAQGVSDSPNGTLQPFAEGYQAAHSHLQAVLQRGRFAVTAEIGPPRGANVAPIRRKARLLRDWVDAANVTDSQSAVVRLPSWAGCLVAMQEGVEPVMQIQCRDKNRIALQSDLLGAAALGIPNVLLLTGDHPRFGDHPDAKAVFDMDSIELIWTARTMREQRKLLSGRELKPAPDWFIGAVENPFAPPFEWRAERLGKKVAAGA